MSETDIERDPDATEESPATATGDETPAKEEKRPGTGGPAWIALFVAVFALAGVGYLAWTNWRGAHDASADASRQALERRVDAAQEATAAVASSVAALEEADAAAAEAANTLRQDLDEDRRALEALPPRIAALEGSVASLAGISQGTRDTWLLAEAEHYMQIANAQLQLSDNPDLAALALRMADERIVQLANPGLTDVRREISSELAALDAMAKPDTEGLTLTLGALAHVVETLPLASEAEETGDDGTMDSEASGVDRAWASVKNAMSGLVKVTPPEKAKLVQLSPDAEFFLRNNLALQLQAARLALLRGEQAIFEQTLDDTAALLDAYFDVDSAQVASARATIAEIRGSELRVDKPDISGSLRLLRQFRTRAETAQ